MALRASNYWRLLNLADAERPDMRSHAERGNDQNTPLSRLQAGQQRWFNSERATAIGQADSNAIAWNEGRLIAARMPLGQFLDELARHRPGVLRCDPAVAELPLTGVFPLADTDRVLAALQQSLPVQVQRVTRYWVTVRPR